MTTSATAETLGDALEFAAEHAEPWRGFHFLGDEGGAEPFFSFAGLERASARFGGAMQALGLHRGDRIALILPDNDDFVFCFFGAIRAGLVPVPMYPPTGVGNFAAYLENARHIVAHSTARALVTTTSIKRMLGTIKASCPTLRQVVAIEGLRNAKEPLHAHKANPDDVAFLQFTSGSTSRPKGVVLTHANIIANLRAIEHDSLRVTPDDVCVSWLPLYHDMGLIGFVIAPVFERIPVALIPPLEFLKRPIVWLRAMSRFRGTLSFAPNFAYALASKRIRERDMHGLDLSSWRVAGCGAEPIRAETLQTFARTFGRFGFKETALLPSYGMAESTLGIAFSALGSGVVTDVVHGPTLWQDGSAQEVSADHAEAVQLVRCGRAFPGHRVAVFAVDDDHSEKPLGDRMVGELRVQGPSVMRGYFDDRERTTSAFAGGWLRTGDLGYLVEGDVVPCGRIKEIIIVNGRNFYPQDIEWEVSKVEGVRKGNVIAFGTWSNGADRERVVVLFETPAHSVLEKTLLVTAVRRAIQEGLGLTVDDVVPLPEGALPKTSSGKLQRLQARQYYESGSLDRHQRLREMSRVDEARELLRSQMSFAVSRLFNLG